MEQRVDPCLLLLQDEPGLHTSDEEGANTVQVVAKATANHVLSTSSARLYDIRLASLRANATYYTTSAAVTATIPGLMAAAGLSILHVQEQLTALASNLRFKPWLGRQTVMLRAWLSVGMVSILHLISALPSIVFLQGVSIMCSHRIQGSLEVTCSNRSHMSWLP